MPKQQNKKRQHDAGDILLDAAQTFEERQMVYSNNYLRLANAMVAMYPQGLTLKTPDDWIRLYFYLSTITKLSRYATNWHQGGHRDSIHDAIVYTALLEAYDAWR